MHAAKRPNSTKIKSAKTFLKAFPRTFIPSKFIPSKYTRYTVFRSTVVGTVAQYSRTSIIRHGNSLKKKFSKNGHVSSCYHGHRNVNLLRMRKRDQGVVYPIRLSGLFSYPAWLRNKGVRIIEVLLYHQEYNKEREY